jgi:Holliday junction resolvase
MGWDHVPKKSKPTLSGAKKEKTWETQEKRLAKRTNSRRVPGSGASVNAKGDVRGKDYLIEAKSTEKLSLSIKMKWLEKITKEAKEIARKPMLAITFKDMPLLVDKDWVMIPLSDFKELVGEEEE